MNKEWWQILTTAAVVIGLALFASGCGGSGGGGGSPVVSSTITVNGVANLGVVRGGVVKAYRLDSGSKGALLDSYSGTGNAGDFVLHITNYQGPMLLELTPGTNATFLDEYTGTYPLLTSTMHSVTPAVLADQYANITPLTEVATAGALKKMAVAGTDPAQGVTEALAQVGAAFLGGNDPLTVTPDDLSQVTANGDGKYAGVLAGIAGLATTRGKSIAALTADFYGQLFPTAGSIGALTVNDINDLYAHIKGAPIKSNVQRKPQLSQPIGDANIARALAGDFSFVMLGGGGIGPFMSGNLTLSSTAPSVTLNNTDPYGFKLSRVSSNISSVGISATNSLFSNGTWGFTLPSSVQSLLNFQILSNHGAIAVNGEMIAGLSTDSYASSSSRFMLGMRKSSVPFTMLKVSGVWDWVVIGSQNRSFVTWHGNLTLTSKGGMSGSLIPSTSNVKRSFNGDFTSDSYAESFVINDQSAAGGVVPAHMRFIPSADGNSAITYFSAVPWGIGIALRRNTKIHNIRGKLYHYFSLKMQQGGKSITSQGEVSTVSSGGRFTGKVFSVAGTKKMVATPFTLKSITSAITSEPSTISLSNGNEPSLAGYVATDGSVIVAEDPGKGIRLLLRQ